MSYLTDDARAPFRDAEPDNLITGQSLESIVAANPARRTILKQGMMGISLFPFLGALAACGDDDNDTPTPAPTPTPTPTVSYAINYTSVAINRDDKVTVPTGYSAEVIFSAGDVVESGVTAYSGTFPTLAQSEKWAGGNHDGMEFYEIAGTDPNVGGLLAINFEYPDFNILMSGAFDAATATADQKALALSAVGVAVIEIAKGSDGKWAVKAGSKYNKRYTGNMNYRAGGPAAGALTATIKGTLNNCSSGRTPWGTYLTCEETTNNYFDTSQPATNYGWVLEIDPYGEIVPTPTKRTALGRFSHENVAFLTDADNRVAFYMGDDSTPGCIYKFVADRAYSTTNRAANTDLLDYGTLYVARFNADGTGDWIALTQGSNGLTATASDPGNTSQSTTPPAATPVSFANQSDVLLRTQSAARVAGGTLMDRPEWITVAPDKSAIYCTLTNNSGRRVTIPADPRVQNLHGHIIKWKEEGNSPLAIKFTWEIVLLAGNPALAEDNLKGNINGDIFSSPDGLRLDPQGRLWVETDHNLTGNAGTLSGAATTMEGAFGNNSMYNIDPTTKLSKRFLVGPVGCEITGLTYTPDLKNFFINIQHPTGAWPTAGVQPRSSTIVVRRTDGQPVGN